MNGRKESGRNRKKINIAKSDKVQKVVDSYDDKWFEGTRHIEEEYGIKTEKWK